ncbi:factor-independent urate hydroxylase [Streptomyces albipurpureus]|uniref:Uricase n=1 Tax=Streptomyces albipurpureus TaxID=2897419 RepID=A0ABT0UW10_9ACTN|nr:urate oxidase [Streptomyces sp. CWNU-1]MCM2392778.1 urate oxidase [Streptomyces sp. CWNU-1]
MPAILGQNQYGKSENRVVRIVRDGGIHRLKDLSVSISLSGDMAEVHHSGSNAHVLPTDTTKNTVYAFAKEYGIESAEQFGIHLARHFVTSQQHIQRARIRIEEYAWERIQVPMPGAGEATTFTEATEASGHSFVRSGQETRVCQITYDGARWQIISGLEDLTVMNSTNSEFWGYVKDRYTTLQEAYDRILATDVSARWRHGWEFDENPMPAWEDSYAQAKRYILQAFAETYSYSLQQTLYAMGSRVLEGMEGIDEIRFSLPNKHHFLVDLKPFDLTNDHEVYLAADRPFGLIEATVLRDGAAAEIPVDLTGG